MTIRPGSFVRISGTTEILEVVAVRDKHAWLVDDIGNAPLTECIGNLVAVPYAEAGAYRAACSRVAFEAERMEA